VALCHFFLRERVKPGDRVVDATCGNGHDTRLLAQLVGPAGEVWGFDIQEQALEATRSLLVEDGLLGRVELVHAGHERLAEFVREPLAAVVFNLGYLPGGEKGIITRPETTRAALAATFDLLASGGVLLAVIYSGHPGGREEEDSVLAWADGLDPRSANAWTCGQPNRPASAPFLLVVEKQ
jgi:predicted methyltransferase